MRAVLLSVPEDVILADTSQSIVDMACNMPDGAVAKSKFFDEELDAFIITVEHDSFDDVKDGAVQPIINAEFAPPPLDIRDLVCENTRMAIVTVTSEQIEEAEARFNRQEIIDKAINVPNGSAALNRRYDPYMNYWLIGIEHDSFPIIKDVCDITVINAEFEQHLGKPLANPDKPIIGVGGEEVMAPPAHFREPDTGDSNISENTSMQCGSFPGEIDNGLAKHIEKSMDTDEYKKIAKQVFQTNDHIGAEPEDSKTIANAIEHTDISPTGQVGLINR